MGAFSLLVVINLLNSSVMEQRHESGLLKQANKLHKTGRHRSKRSISNDSYGKMMYSVKAITKQSSKKLAKVERRNQAKEKRKLQREKLMAEKRSRGGADAPPFTVAMVSLTEGVNLTKCLDLLASAYPTSKLIKSGSCQYMILENFQKRICFNLVPDCDLFALLEIAKVADFLLVADVNEKFSSFAEHAFSCLCAQGLPNVLYALTGTEELTSKKKNEAKATLMKILSRRFPKLEKIYSFDTISDAQIVLRDITNQKIKRIKFRECRASIIVDSFELKPPPEETAQVQNLVLRGIVRGRPLSANSLIYLPNLGPFQMKHVQKIPDPYSVKPGKGQMPDDVEYPNDKQMQLQFEAEVDPMDAEQTWPTDAELATASADKMSQDGEGDEDEEYYDCESDVQSLVDQSDLVPEGDEVVSSEGEDDEGDGVSEFGGTSIAEDSFSVLDQEVNQDDLEREKAARDDKSFPDEIDTPFGVLAKDRFQKYRGLQSFKHTPWDPKENLPSDFARIFTFDNIERIKKTSLSLGPSIWALGQPGTYVEIELINVPVPYCNELTNDKPLIVFSLLDHEQKFSVCNFYLKRHPASDSEIKSKDELIFWTPLRTFSARPIFSDHTLGNKHKFERFFHQDSAVIASVICPITFGPCPVLVFQKNANAEDVSTLVATGSLGSINPYRVVVKRAVLSGYPCRILKRYVVARYMFHNREDITWFKPVQLRTKWGRKGHIIEPLGTHGNMKCKFDAHLKSQDTIMMNLYKRVFPKLTYNPSVEEFGIDIPDSLIAGSVKSSIYNA